MIRQRLIAAILAGTVIATGCATSPEPSATGSPGTDPAINGDPPAWRTATVLLADRKAFHAARGVNGLVVADMTAWVETDGDRWMPAEAKAPPERVGIAVWQGRLVAWADGGGVQTSEDGSTWAEATKGPGQSNLETSVSFGDRLVLLGDGIETRTGAWSSPDGSTWTPIKTAPLEMKAATSLPRGGLVAVGAAGPSVTWTTSDTITWKQAGDLQPAGVTTSTLYGVAASAARVVAIGVAADAAVAAWSSDDLRIWARSPNRWGNDSYLSSVAFVHGLFVIAGRRGTLPVVWLSADGRVWSSSDLPIAAGVQAEAVETIARDGKLVVFGYSTQDAGNGGSISTGYLVWTLVVPT